MDHGRLSADNFEINDSKDYYCPVCSSILTPIQQNLSLNIFFVCPSNCSNRAFKHHEVYAEKDNIPGEILQTNS